MATSRELGYNVTYNHLIIQPSSHLGHFQKNYLILNFQINFPLFQTTLPYMPTKPIMPEMPLWHLTLSIFNPAA